MQKIGTGGIRIGRLDVYFVRVRHNEPKHLVFYWQTKNGRIKRWEFG